MSSATDLDRLSRAQLEDLLAVKLRTEVGVLIEIGLAVAQTLDRDWLVSNLSESGGRIGASPIDHRLILGAIEICARVRAQKRARVA